MLVQPFDDAALPQQRQDFGLVPSQCVEHGLRWFRGGFQQEMIAIECEFYTGGPGGLVEPTPRS